MNRIHRVLGIGAALAVLVGALPLAACGGGGGGDDSGPAVINVIGNEPTQNPNRVEATIEVKDNSFTPDVLTIKAGTKVTWNWVDTANPHSIQLGGQTSTQQTSGKFERVFEQSGGSFSYQCGVHGASMAGKIVIE